MKNDEFRALVRKMREEQNNYFRTRAVGHLIEARELEKKVDDELSQQRELPIGDEVKP